MIKYKYIDFFYLLYTVHIHDYLLHFIKYIVW